MDKIDIKLLLIGLLLGATQTKRERYEEMVKYLETPQNLEIYTHYNLMSELEDIQKMLKDFKRYGVNCNQPNKLQSNETPLAQIASSRGIFCLWGDKQIWIDDQDFKMKKTLLIILLINRQYQVLYCLVHSIFSCHRNSSNLYQSSLE